MRGLFKKKGAIEMSYLGWIILAVAATVFITIAIFVMKEKGFDAIRYLKDSFRFG